MEDKMKFLTFLAELCNVANRDRIQLDFVIQVSSSPRSEVPTYQCQLRDTKLCQEGQRQLSAYTKGNLTSIHTLLL